jgi:hypothetical protein
LRRRPWPTIESCSQTGHRRKIISSESSAQRAASRSSGTDTGTKRIVTSHGSRFPLRTAKMLAGSGTPPPEEIQLKENITSYCKPRSRGPAYWPLIAAESLTEDREGPRMSPSGVGSIETPHRLAPGQFDH